MKLLILLFFSVEQSSICPSCCRILKYRKYKLNDAGVASIVFSRKLTVFSLPCDRPDGHQNNLRSAAYEALMEIVKNSAKDCYPAVQKTTLVIMERLQQVLQMEVGWRAEACLVWRQGGRLG